MASAEEVRREEVELEKRRADAVLTACNFGIVEELERLLAEGATFSCRDKTGATPLFFAAARGHADVIDLLCAHGVDPNDDDSLGRTPLHAAAAHDRADAVRALMRRDAWIEAPDHADDTPLHLAARMAGVNTVEALLRHGAKVDAINKLGLTPLCEAAVVRERFDVADALVRGGASPPSERVNGFALTHVAAAMNRTRALEWLRRREVDEEEEDERQAEEGARRRGGGDEDAPGAMTPLHCAAATGAVRAVQWLLANESDRRSSQTTRAGWNAASTDADGRTAADVMRDGEAGDAESRERAAREMERAATWDARSATRDGTRKSRAGSGEVEFSAALSVAAQRARVMEWSRVAPGERAERGVPRAAWSALDARAELTRRADLGDFLQRLVDDEDFQADMKTPRVRPAVEEVIENFHNVQRWRDDATVMGVLDKFGHVQRYCKEAGVRIRFEDVIVKNRADADERRGRIAKMRRAADDALERAREDVLAFAPMERSTKREAGGGGAEGPATERLKTERLKKLQTLAFALAAVAAVLLAAAVRALGGGRGALGSSP